MSNVIRKLDFLQLEKENDERNNKNIRQSMTIIRKKVVTLQAEYKQNEYESNNHQRQGRTRGGES